LRASKRYYSVQAFKHSFPHFQIYSQNSARPKIVDLSQSPQQGVEGQTHYDGYKVLDFIESLSLPFCEGNAVKYICRHSKKGGVKDIDKAIDYLQQIKRLRYPNDTNG
jgi:uncharacterized protein DUF3310